MNVKAMPAYVLFVECFQEEPSIARMTWPLSLPVPILLPVVSHEHSARECTQHKPALRRCAPFVASAREKK